VSHRASQKKNHPKSKRTSTKKKAVFSYQEKEKERKLVQKWATAFSAKERREKVRDTKKYQKMQ
jgi:hypothetical protein